MARYIFLHDTQDQVYLRVGNFDFIVMLWRDMIQVSEFSPFRDFSLGVQERRAQSKHGGQTVMIRGVQRRHDGSSQRLAWDPGTVVFDNSTTDTDEMASFRFPEFTLGMLRIGCLEEWSSEELTKFMQLMISWLIKEVRWILVLAPCRSML
jgi:hypothetical protein